MTKEQALYVARQIMVTAQEQFTFDGYEDKFKEEYGVTHAELINALPIISAMELLA